MNAPTAGQPFNFAQHLLSLNTTRADKAAFVSLTKARHAEIFASVESADSIATRLKAALQSDARLAKYAEAV